MKKAIVEIVVPGILSFVTWTFIGIIEKVDIITSLQVGIIVGGCVSLAFLVFFIGTKGRGYNDITKAED